MRKMHLCLSLRKKRVNTLKTLIELYDEESVFNLVAACTVKPENLVIIGGEQLENDVLRKRINRFILSRNIGTEVKYKICNIDDCTAVIEALAQIVEEYADCVIDVSGGNDIALLACGMFAESCDVPLMRLDAQRQCFADVRSCPEAERLDIPLFTVDNMIAMTGAEVIRHGRVSAKNIDDELRSDITELWKIFTNYRTSWHKATLFFHSASESADDCLSVNTKATLPIDKNYCPPTLLNMLADSGLITDYESTRERIRFMYKNATIRFILRDKGAVLELMTYCRLYESGMFDDIDTSVVIDWDGSGSSATTNEIDVMAVRGLTTYFISCKSAGSENLSSEYLYEIDTMARRLGGRFAQPVLVTAVSDIRHSAQPMWERAHDMRVIIADSRYIENGRLGELIANYKRKPLNK